MRRLNLKRYSILVALLLLVFLATGCNSQLQQAQASNNQNPSGTAQNTEVQKENATDEDNYQTALTNINEQNYEEATKLASNIQKQEYKDDINKKIFESYFNANKKCLDNSYTLLQTANELANKIRNTAMDGSNSDSVTLLQQNAFDIEKSNSVLKKYTETVLPKDLNDSCQKSTYVYDMINSYGKTFGDYYQTSGAINQKTDFFGKDLDEIKGNLTELSKQYKINIDFTGSKSSSPDPQKTDAQKTDPPKTEIKPFPLKLDGYSYDKNSIGTPRIYLKVTNNGSQAIDAFDFVIQCLNNYGETVKGYGVNDLYGGTYQAEQGNIGAGKSFSSSDKDVCWTLYGFDTATKYKVAITKVHTTDGQTYKLDPNQYVWISK